MSHSNIYNKNQEMGAESNPLMANPDEVDSEFALTANTILKSAVETLRDLIGAHQSAAAIIINKDWHYVRKFFSLSEKYSNWKDYDTKATGFGIHNWLLHQNKIVRLTQKELLEHPEWKGFGLESVKHPPMNGWLAIPLTDSQGNNWGLLQLSDKYEGEFSLEDEEIVKRYSNEVSLALELAWSKRNLRKNID